MISSSTIGWLAGIVEGEGSFGKHTMNICVAMTDKDVVERIADLFDSPPYKRGKPPRPSHKQSYSVYLCGNRAAGWLMTIYGLMGTRRKEQIRSCLLRWKKSRMGWKRGERLRPICHPEAKYKANNLCVDCYNVSRRDARRLARKPPVSRCINGHLYDAANTYHWNGQRRCRACGRERLAVKRKALVQIHG